MSKQSRPADRASREIAQWLLEIKFGVQVIVRWLGRKEDTRSVPYPHELMEEDDGSVKA
jgi:hypothetical protein